MYVESGSEKWDESDDDDAITDIEPGPPQNCTNEDQKLKMLVKWIMVFISRLRILFSISDAAFSYILKFLSVFLGLFSQVIYPSGNLFTAKVPSSIYMMRQMLGGIKKFTRFVVCRKCNHIYELEECKDRNGQGKKCPFVRFPNHSQRRMRQPCGTILLKTVIKQ